MTRIEIRLLGRFTVVSEAGQIELTARPAHLLAYLALSGGRWVPRTRIAGALWPDLPEERARANLSTVMWRLGSTLAAHGHPTDVLRVSSTLLGLNMDRCEVDAEQFRRGALRPGQSGVALESLSRTIHALQYYKGDLLEDWDVEWCQLERENLKQCYVSTLQALAEGFERRGRCDLALGYARQATEADPFNEPAQRAFMRLLSRVGDKAAAVSQFQRFARLTRSELGVEPDTETMTLLAEIRRPEPSDGVRDAQRPVGPTAIHPERAPLIGRHDERQLVTTLLDAAATGSGGGVLLLGDAGIGKSRFAEWVAEEWAARGGATLRGRCIEFNEPVPYQPVLDALSAFVDSGDITEFVSRDGGMLAIPSLDDATGSDGSSSPWPSGKLRLFNWLRATLEETSQRRPVLVLIEDLQWADTGSIDFLMHLLERARCTRVVVLLTARPVGSRPVHESNLDKLSRYCAVVLRLGPLSRAETCELVKALLDEPTLPLDLASRIFAESEGNPLFVVETLRLLQQQERVPASVHASEFGRGGLPGSDLGIPDGVRAAVQHRLSLLDPRARRVAEVASVLGRSFDEELLAMVIKGGQNRLARDVEHLLRFGIFERENVGYRFSHDKIRAVCYQNVPAHLGRAYHVRAAAALAQWPDVPMHRLAWHQHSAGQWHLAAGSWTQAGDQARKIYAYEEALLAYRRAVFCIRRDKTRDADGRVFEEMSLLVRSDETLEVLGKPRDRKAVLDQMGWLCQRNARSLLQTAWLTRSALFEDHAGNFDQAACLARRAWAIARSAGNQQAETEALRVLAWAKNRAGQHRRSLAITRVLLRKLQGRPSPTRATALWQAAAAYVKLGDYGSALSLVKLARGILLELGYLDEVPLILMVEALVFKWTGDSQSSRARLLKALQVSRETGDRTTETRATIHLAALDALDQRLRDAMVGVRKASIESRSSGYTRGHFSCLNEVANSVGRLMGNYRWAWNASARALELPVASGSRHLVAICKDSQAQLCIDQYQVDEAERLVDEVLRLSDLERPSGDPYGPFLESLAKRGVIALLRGDYQQAIVDLERAREIQTRASERLMLPDTLTYLAVAYARLGDADRALATSGEALELLAEIGHANLQPQRPYWHHFLILELFDRTPRLPYLSRAVEFIDAQAATLSRAQQVRLRRDVPLNRAILAAWERHRDAAHRDATHPDACPVVS